MADWSDAFKAKLVETHKAGAKLPACPDDGARIDEYVDPGSDGRETMIKCSRCGQFETYVNDLRR